MSEAFLPQIEIERGDALAEAQQCDRDMHRDGRFADAALFVSEHNDVRRSGPQRTRLHQHRTYLAPALYLLSVFRRAEWGELSL
jgi:hypothetical protein